MEELLTIKESALFTGKSESVLYKFIRKNKLTVQNQIVTIQGTSRTVKKLSRSELEKVFNLTVLHGSEPPDYTVQNQTEPKENLKEILEQFFTEKETQLMKPLEQQALYRLGRVEQENEFLRQQVETLRNELDAVKLLPVEDTTSIKEENEKLKKQLSILPAEPLEVNKILMQNADNLRDLQEKLNLLPAEPEKVNEILKLGVEKYKALEDNFIKQSGEKEHLEEELKKLQQEAEEMRLKLSKPWWKWW